MRGNGLNCLRIAPYSAVQFATYESMKRALLRFSSFRQQHLGFSDKASSSHSTELHTFERLVAGAVAGFTSVVSTYPLDLVRARISIASASMYTTAGTSATVLPRVPGVWETTMKVYRDEGGFRGLYRGCIATSLGVAPYVAFNFVFYESARSFLTKSDGTPPGPFTKLCIGAFAGAVSQTLTYPVDVVRRRMQVSGMKNSSLGVQDKGVFCSESNSQVVSTLFETWSLLMAFADYITVFFPTSSRWHHRLAPTSSHTSLLLVFSPICGLDEFAFSTND